MATIVLSQVAKITKDSEMAKKLFLILTIQNGFIAWLPVKLVDRAIVLFPCTAILTRPGGEDIRQQQEGRPAPQQ